MTNTKKTNSMNETTVLSSYLNEISKVSLLTQDEETELAVRAAAGDTAAKNKIISSNLRFVVNVAKKYQNRGLDLEDLISEGNIGLIMAIERFDVSKGYKFISYAVWWIRQSILKAINEKSRMIRLPANKALEMGQINFEKRRIASSDKSEAEEITEIAKNLGMTESHVKDMLNISKEMISLDNTVSSDSSTTTVGDFIEDTSNLSPEEQSIETVLKEDIDSLLDNTLTEREAYIIRRRFGLNGYSTVSLKDLGTKLNLSKERVRQIEKKAIGLLKSSSRSYKLEGYVA
ncbi:MAG: RNA polymerase sigma factor RpoD/SigA [Spirochaetaceae bacterium]|nr:RNA polymerase sigma factor RpoD/SigA [Spirochaetaceae bacterium]